MSVIRLFVGSVRRLCSTGLPHISLFGDVPMPICHVASLSPYMSACQVHREAPALTGTDRCIQKRNARWNIRLRMFNPRPGSIQPQVLVTFSLVFRSFHLPPLFVLHLMIPNLFWVFLLFLFKRGLEKDSVFLSD